MITVNRTQTRRLFSRPADWALITCTACLVVACRADLHGPTRSLTPLPTPAVAGLRLESKPAGAVVFVNGEEKGQTPLTLDLAAGSYEVAVRQEGYLPWQQNVQLRPGEQLVIAEQLRDAAPPALSVSGLPESVPVGQLIRIRAEATDNEALRAIHLWIDGELRTESQGPILEYAWETSAVGAGTHTIVVEARDDAGNVSQASHSVELTEPAASEPSSTVEPTTTSRAGASAQVTALTLLSYPYEAFLRERVDPRYGFRVVWLDRAAYEASNPQPQLRTFKAVVLENRYLSLTFLPELGGRLYKCTVKSTGQNIFYQNPVLKPSYWGPLSREQNWWLAAGGMEWALPVHEHGYEWGVLWAYNVEEHSDGVSIVLSDNTAEAGFGNDRVWAQIRVTLPDDRAYFIVEPRLVNPTGTAAAFQFWLNAALTLGADSMSAGTDFYYPTEQMVVHSTGDDGLPGERQTMSWPVHEGRDLSHYRNWRNWLGVFVPEVQQGYAGAYNHDTDLGIVRIFPPAIARGLKLFAFGSDFAARAEYTDGGSEYFEMWAGPCKTFWGEDDLVLDAGQSLHWSEVWLPFTNIGGLDRANAEAVVTANAQDGQVRLGIAVSRRQQVKFHLRWNGQPFYQGSAAPTPETPLMVVALLPSGASPPGELTVLVKDGKNMTLLEYSQMVMR